MHQWKLSPICSKTDSLPVDFFQYSIFGKSLNGLSSCIRSKAPSALKIMKFREWGFPIHFCNTLERGLPLLLKATPPKRSVPNHAPARDAENLTFVKETLEKWELMGVFRYVSDEPYIVNPLNVVINGVKKRLVLDARASGLNEYILAPKFQLPDVELIINSLSVNDYLIKIDLASGFLQLPINPEEQTFLGFKSPVDGKFGVLQRLPFGLRSAPFLFQSFTHALRKGAQETLGIETQVYIDDWLLWNQRKEKLMENFTRFQNFLEDLGVAIQHEKTEGPGQAITYLGLIIDTAGQRVVLPETKRIKYLEGISNILKEKNTSMAALAKTAGRLVHIATVHKAGAANIQPLWEVIYFDRKQWTKKQLEKEMLAINDDLFECLQWWEEVLSNTNLTRKIWKTPDGHLFLWSMKAVDQHASQALTIATDASDEGWGASTGLATIAGTWSTRQKETSINWRELKTPLIAINEWNFLRESPVLLLTDNATVVAAIRKRASKAEPLQYLIRELMKLEKRRSIEIVAIHLPGNLNDLPDRLSRGLPTEEASVLPFNPDTFPTELRSCNQLIGMSWNQSKWDTCPFSRKSELNVVDAPLLIAITTPDLPFLKLHLKKLARNTASTFILLPKVPSSELPLEFTQEVYIEASPICLIAESTKWAILKVIYPGGTDARIVT